MALYNNSAFGSPYKTNLRIGQGTLPLYLFGNFNPDTIPWRFQVTAVAGTGSVATATVRLLSGGSGPITLLPSVGAKMGVQGTHTNSGGFNVDPTLVTGVTLDMTTGLGSITYACTSSASTTADSGTLVIQPYEFPDLVSSGSSSIPASLIFTPDESDNSRCLFAEAKWYGTMPTTATVVLQAANVDDDARYMTLENDQGCLSTGTIAASDALASVAGSVVTQSGAQYSFILGKFLRAKVLAMTGGDSTTALAVTLFV